MATGAMTPGHTSAIVAAAIAFAMPTVASAQDVGEVVDPDTALYTETVALDDEPSCIPEAEANEALVPEVEEAEPVFVMPTTGMAFTLPPDEPPAELEICAPLPPVRPMAPSLFRMIALPVGLNSSLEKWERARLGAVTDRPGPWDELLAQANMIAPGDPIDMVNRWVNWHIRYRIDLPGDEWATAPDTLSRGFGDCEDFAVAKMGLLLALGIPADDMYLVLLRDQRQTDHAVLAVNRDGRLYVLDNRTDTVLPADQIYDYTPIVSYSGPFSWIYGRPAG